MSNVDVLVVAPHAPELEGLGAVLGRELTANLQGIQVVAKSVGLGLPGVAGGTVQRLERFRPRALVMLGTCAAYPGRGLTPGQVVVAEQVAVADAAVLKGWSSFPDPMTGRVVAHPGMVGGLSNTGTRRVGVASPCAVTSDPNLAHSAPQRSPDPLGGPAATCLLGIGERQWGAAMSRPFVETSQRGDDRQ